MKTTAEQQYQLGLKYYNGDGLKKNYSKAVELWQKASSNGNTKAMYSLGTCYIKGKGVAKNVREGMWLYKLAALSGDANAQLKQNPSLLASAQKTTVVLTSSQKPLFQSTMLTVPSVPLTSAIPVAVSVIPMTVVPASTDNLTKSVTESTSSAASFTENMQRLPPTPTSPPQQDFKILQEQMKTWHKLRAMQKFIAKMAHEKEPTDMRKKLAASTNRMSVGGRHSLQGYALSLSSFNSQSGEAFHSKTYEKKANKDKRRKEILTFKRFQEELQAKQKRLKEEQERQQRLKDEENYCEDCCINCCNIS